MSLYSHWPRDVGGEARIPVSQETPRLGAHAPPRPAPPPELVAAPLPTCPFLCRPSSAQAQQPPLDPGCMATWPAATTSYWRTRGKWCWCAPAASASWPGTRCAAWRCWRAPAWWWARKWPRLLGCWRRGSLAGGTSLPSTLSVTCALWRERR